MKRCQACGANNLNESQFCDECGAALMKNEDAENEAMKMSSSSGGFQTQMSEMPVFQSTNVTSIGIPNIAEVIKEAEKSLEKSKQPKGKNVHANLVIERGNLVGSEFPLSTDESLIGRWDADNGIFPDVDLDRYDPEAKISRRHARILHNDGQYAIEDLGSTNGTFINRGRRLIPGNSQLLKDGDEIIVGKTFLRFIISQ
jgi:DNA-directed RNA polymerase subunit M/transcription elongation factor TFIIS